MTKWHMARIALWLFPIGFEVFLEFRGLTNPNYPTLSALLRLWIPTWLRAMIVGWLAYHFVVITTGK